MGAIHCHDLHALAVELDVGIREDILDGFDKGAKGCGFYGADAKQGIGVHSTAESRPVRLDANQWSTDGQSVVNPLFTASVSGASGLSGLLYPFAF